MDRGRIAVRVDSPGTQTAPGPTIRAAREERPRPTSKPFLKRLRSAGLSCHLTDEDVMRVFVPGDDGARELFALAAAERVQVRHLRQSVPTLEDVFARAIGEE